METTTSTATATTFQPSSPNVILFSASIGDILKINRPSGYPPFVRYRTSGWPSYATDQSINPVNEYSAWGFRVTNKTLGKFVDFETLGYDAGYIYYQHEKSGKQIIEYISNGIQVVRFYAIVSAIQVHDHASVYTGGPAFATYYADVEHAEET